MRLFAHYSYRLTKADTIGSIFDRVLRTFDVAPRVEFLLADHAGGKGVARVVKRFPELGPFECTAPEPPDGWGGPQLVHLDARFREHVAGREELALDVASLAELAAGIPRRFPLEKAIFYFPDVSWADVAAGTSIHPQGSWYAGPPLPAAPVPGIILSRYARRRISLDATVPLPVPAPDGRKLPNVADKVDRKLRELGTFGAPELRVVLDASEEPKAAVSDRMNEIAQSWEATLPALLDELPLAHALAPSPREPVQGSGLTSPHKAALVSTFRPRGWKYSSEVSGHGTFTLVKPSPRGNRILLFLDVGSYSHSCGGFVALEGPGWRAVFRLGFVRGHSQPQYPIVDDVHWTQIVENIAVVVEHLEQTNIAETEALFPPSPEWFGRLT